MKQGKVIKLISNSFTVLADKEYTCSARGKVKSDKNLVVGDNVLFDSEKLIIEKILNRKNSLIRPLVSNIDQALIVASVKKPDLDFYLLDKLLCIIEFNNINPIICFTKLDLLEDLTEVNKVINYYKKIGYQVFTNQNIEEVKKVFENKITVFTGQSGAGKSTLLNSIDNKLNIKTNEISKALGRGKHTTRHVELLKIVDGMCADTPGFSSITFESMSPSDIRDNMIEFNDFKQDCLYRDCMHLKEEDCEVKRQLDNDIMKTRYDNYLKFVRKEEL